MFGKRDQDLLAEAYNSIHGGSDWRGEYKAVAETVYNNLSRAKSAEQFFGMFGRPSYLVRALDQVHDAARKEDIYLQNDPEFGNIGIVYTIHQIDQGRVKSGSFVENDIEEWFNSNKPKVQNEMDARAKLSKLNAYIDRLGEKNRKTPFGGSSGF